MTRTKGKASNGNTIYDGVEVDTNGMVTAYHIANTYAYELMAEETVFTRVEAYGKLTGLPNILHIMESERPDQYRGVPYLAQVIEPMLQMRRYTEAEIMAAVVQAFQTGFVTTDAGTDEMPFKEAATRTNMKWAREQSISWRRAKTSNSTTRRIQTQASTISCVLCVCRLALRWKYLQICC